MALSYELISQFAKLATGDKKTSTEATVYGTVMVDANGNKYVKLDGSDQLTPLTDNEQPALDSSSTNANEGDRVSVLIKNHTATVTGNISPSGRSARTEDVEDLGDQVTEIKKFDILVTEQLTAQEGYIKKLQTDKANVGDLTAATAKITELEAKNVDITGKLTAAEADITDIKATKLDVEVANAKFATVEELDAATANIDDLEAKNLEVTNKLTAAEANITTLHTTIFDAESGEIKFATIDFANIGEAAIRKIFSDSGLIKDLVVGDQTITGELVGVTIKGDLIEGNTIIADKLVVKGDDGLYYKLNYESGVLSGDEVAKTFYYVVTYDSETGEYTTTTKTPDPEGTLLDDTYTTDDREVYALEDGSFYCMVAETFYYAVTYESESGEYTTTTETLNAPEGILVEGVYTTDEHEVYTLEDGSFYCEVAKTFYYVVTYDSETGEYTTTTKTPDPEGALLDDTYTTDDREIYALEDGSFYCVEVVYPNWAKESLHGSIITAKSVTAEKVNVDDLVAFGATIGGFSITDSAIHSGVKESIDNSNSGVYLDKEGQFALGDLHNYIRFYKVVDAEGNDVLDEDGNQIYKLEISADSILFGADSKTSGDDLKKLTEHVKIGTWTDYAIKEVPPDEEDNVNVLWTSDDFVEVVKINDSFKFAGCTGVYLGTLEDGSEIYCTEFLDWNNGTIWYLELDVDTSPSVELAEGDTTFRQVITNKKTMFMDSDVPNTVIDTDGVSTDNLSVDKDLRHNNPDKTGSYAWAFRANGNYGLSWKEDVIS